ncbi:RNase adapter RapZ [Denitrobaculum tricleocarpae]|uniref:RNase adapter RapZ n=2 Tax=Denitrobaculum tricleocarpae TaxID=2591009 RepID=A0A545TG27_9PROT|nr:RNase adapter RapZ [Denitrobaculum tricleocarpae]
MPQETPRMCVILVTGLSGAGRSSALRILEDVGFEAIDNLPLNLLETMIDEGGAERKVAVGVDIRTRNFAVAPFLQQLDTLENRDDLDLKLLFLDCDAEVLSRRFTETRRRHPLSQDRPLHDGIMAERRLVFPLRKRADYVIDTSSLTLGALRQQMVGQLGLSEGSGMAIFVTSFSYRLGLPREADLVFDVRFLTNPHYVQDLRPLSGRDAAVVDYIATDSAFEPFFEQLTAMLRPLLPRYESEGKSYLTIAFGCTGGRHRSVALAEQLAAWLTDHWGKVSLVHRDIDRESQRERAANPAKPDPQKTLKDEQ